VFIRGGELVEFFVDDLSLGKNLSGVTGRLTGSTRLPAGLKTIRAVSRNSIGRGTLLVVKPGSGIVAVDVEGTLLQGGFMNPDAREPAGNGRGLEATSTDLPPDRGYECEGGPQLAHGERVHAAPFCPGTAAPFLTTSRRRAEDPRSHRRPGSSSRPSSTNPGIQLRACERRRAVEELEGARGETEVNSEIEKL